MTSEHQIQCHVSKKLKQLGILHHSDQNGSLRGKSAGAKAKMAGMCAGWPDMTIVNDEEMILVEFKRMGGELSNAQKIVHGKLLENNILVHTVYALDEEDAWKQVAAIMDIS